MEPIRLQKWLACCGLGSRRACEVLIKAGRITVNGQVATLGMKVDPAHDRILVEGKPLEAPPQRVYLMLHKPRGYITTCSDPHAKKTVMDLVAEVPVLVFPVGRLDADSEGLLLLTNDGELAHRLLHPRHKVPKTYRVWVRGQPSRSALQALRNGVMLEDGRTAPAQVRMLSSSTSQSVLEITLREGRRHQVRRMCEVVGHPVRRLVRVAFGPLKLPPELLPGQWRWLTPEEQSALQNTVAEKQEIASVCQKRKR
ncbi:MAG: pseudouridine synthase [Armatimonadota bacterium]